MTMVKDSGYVAATGAFRGSLPTQVIEGGHGPGATSE
jgi:hypothetical protein